MHYKMENQSIQNCSFDIQGLIEALRLTAEPVFFISPANNNYL